MKPLTFKASIYLLTVVVFLFENCLFSRCVEFFMMSLQGFGGMIPWRIEVVIHYSESIVWVDVCGIILLLCLVFWKKEQEFAISCLLYLTLWSAFLADCACNLLGRNWG